MQKPKGSDTRWHQFKIDSDIRLVTKCALEVEKAEDALGESGG